MFGYEQLQELLSFDAGNDQVVSLYLGANLAQDSKEAIKLQARGLIKEANTVPQEEAEVIERFLNYEHDWSKPGLALFSCSRRAFFRAYPTQLPFRSRLRIGARPYVKPLAHLLDFYAHYGVILVDRIGARFFEYHLGELLAADGTMGEDVRKLKRGRGSSATGMRGGVGGSRGEEEAAQRNLRQAASEAARFFEKRDVRRLFLGGTSETVAQFREYLPKQLQSCIAGTFPSNMDAQENEVRERTLEMLSEANSQREMRLVQTMVTTAAKGGAASVGLGDTLQAVNEGRVHTLVISDGFRLPGFRDAGSGAIVHQQGGLQDAGRLVPLDDVIEQAAARTLEQGGHVEVISGNEQLEQVGRIGALLRY